MGPLKILLASAICAVVSSSIGRSIDTTSLASVRTSLQDHEYPGIDLWNVVFDMGTRKVRVYTPDEVSRKAIDRIGGKLTNHMIATSGPVAEMDIDIIESRPLDFSSDCDVKLPVAAYFVRPWFWDNAWHFMNDATALSSWVRNTPGCDSSLCPNITKALFVYHEKGNDVLPARSLQVTRTMKALFAQIFSWKKMASTRYRYCLSSAHWGLGVRCLGTISRFSHPHTEERRSAVDAYRTAVFKSLGLQKLLFAEKTRAGLRIHRNGFGPNGKLLAVQVAREEKHGRFISTGTVTALRDLFGKSNISFVSCCNFHRQPLAEIIELFGRADFIVGAHGAGLSNMVFAQRGAVLVELKTWFRREQDMFRKIAQARWGGYISVLMQAGGKNGAKLPLDLLDSVVKCATGIWHGNSRGDSRCWDSINEGNSKFGIEGAQAVGGTVDCNIRRKTCHRAIGKLSPER